MDCVTQGVIYFYFYLYFYQHFHLLVYELGLNTSDNHKKTEKSQKRTKNILKLIYYNT